MPPTHLGQRRTDLLLRRADGGHDLTHGETPVAADGGQGRVPCANALLEAGEGIARLHGGGAGAFRLKLQVLMYALMVTAFRLVCYNIPL